MRKFKNKEARVELCSVVPECIFYKRLLFRTYQIGCNELFPEIYYSPNGPQLLRMTNVEYLSQKELSLHPEFRRSGGKRVGRIEDYRGNNLTQELKMKVFRTKREGRITR